MVTGGFVAARPVDAALEAITNRLRERHPAKGSTHGVAFVWDQTATVVMIFTQA